MDYCLVVTLDPTQCCTKSFAGLFWSEVIIAGAVYCASDILALKRYLETVQKGLPRFGTSFDIEEASAGDAVLLSSRCQYRRLEVNLPQSKETLREQTPLIYAIVSSLFWI